MTSWSMPGTTQRSITRLTVRPVQLDRTAPAQSIGSDVAVRLLTAVTDRPLGYGHTVPVPTSEVGLGMPECICTCGTKTVAQRAWQELWGARKRHAELRPDGATPTPFRTTRPALREHRRPNTPRGVEDESLETSPGCLPEAMNLSRVIARVRRPAHLLPSLSTPSPGRRALETRRPLGSVMKPPAIRGMASQGC